MSDTVYTVTDPEGRKYRTMDRAEAEHLVRTEGYRITSEREAGNTKAAAAQTKRRPAARNKARTVSDAPEPATGAGAATAAETGAATATETE